MLRESGMDEKSHEVGRGYEEHAGSQLEEQGGTVIESEIIQEFVRGREYPF